MPVFEIDSDFAAELSAHAFDGSDWFRTNRMAVLAAKEACAQAGLDADALRVLRVGVCLGTTVGCTLNNEPFYRSYRRGELPDTGGVARYLNNNPALLLAQALDLHGPVATVANACSSGTDAIGLGRSWLLEGRCDLVLAGGSDELSRVTCLGFASLMVTSEGACRPFDRRRDGLNLGEGAGVVVLETRTGHRRRGGPSPQGVVLGYGCSADSHHVTAPHPDGKGLERAITRALEVAGIAPGDVRLVNAHGTSTRDNDQVEGRVIARVLGLKVPVVATKAYTGHTLGAAGALEAIFTLKALQDGVAPATAGFEEPDPDCGITPTREVTKLDGGIALSNSLAFGGNNSVLVLARA